MEHVHNAAFYIMTAYTFIGLPLHAAYVAYCLKFSKMEE